MSSQFSDRVACLISAVSNFPETEATARMAFHAGTVSGPTDFALRDSLAQYNTDGQSARRWEMLPYAFAATLGSDLWQRSQYKARTGGAYAYRVMGIAFVCWKLSNVTFVCMRDHYAARSVRQQPPLFGVHDLPGGGHNGMDQQR